MSNILLKSEYINHPKDKGVYLKHFFSSEDNDRLNNLEVRIDPGFEISAHIHENSTEFFYIVEGTGAFLEEGVWKPIQKGNAMKAPTGTKHGIRNTGTVPLLLLATFSPYTR